MNELWIDLFIKGLEIDAFAIITISLLILAIIGIICILYKKIKGLNFSEEHEGLFVIGTAGLLILGLFLAIGVMAPIIWHETMEIPSVREEIVTIQEIQPHPQAIQENHNDNGYTISNSDELIFLTTNGKEFENTETWTFDKFETRTIFNQLRINGTYKIKYYGWRNGHESAFPNILSVEEVINENNTQPNRFDKYFGTHYGQREYIVDSEVI